MKQLWERLRGKKAPWHKNKSFRRAGSHGSKILTEMCAGRMVGGREATVITKSHNGPRRLYYVLKMLRMNGIPYRTNSLCSPAGTFYKAFEIVPGFEDAARKLIIGKGA